MPQPEGSNVSSAESHLREQSTESPVKGCLNLKGSEIPCSLSSYLHERLNDLGTVSVFRILTDMSIYTEPLFDEIGGYNDPMTQQRRSRILVTLGNDPGESPVFLVDSGSCLFRILFNKYMHKDYGHVLYGPGWEKLKRCFDFTNGKRVVLTNMLGNDLRVLVFGDDGYEINHENLPCTKKGHSVVHKDEEAVFYHTLSRHVKNAGSLAIPPDFVTANDLFIFSTLRLSNDLLFILKIHYSANFTSPPGRIYHCAEIEWILGKSLDEGLVPLMSNQDVLSLLQYVPIYKEIKVYIKKNTMEVILGTGKGVVIEEVVEDDEVKEASETGNSGKQLLLVTKNDVQTKTETSTPPWSFESLSDFDISDHPPWSSESVNEKRNKRLKMKNEVKAKQEMEEPVHNDFHPLMYEDDLLQKEDPVNYQQDPYYAKDEAKENAELFDEQDHLLEHVPFLKETFIIVDSNAPLLVVNALVVPPVIWRGADGVEGDDDVDGVGEVVAWRRRWCRGSVVEMKMVTSGCGSYHGGDDDDSGVWWW
uniref:Uncharacterized protein n=1 Tax=Tanacetum cinerariifolium TaxID=118510 RepID=A0A699GRT9_TANCI|nr:hypothetical protein [Tanacetum cinerariifolium]